MIQQDSSQQINQTQIKKRNFLSSEKINLNSFSASKIANDLNTLKKAEAEEKSYLNIDMDTDESTQEMSALKLANPFRGY